MRKRQYSTFTFNACAEDSILHSDSSVYLNILLSSYFVLNIFLHNILFNNTHHTDHHRFFIQMNKYFPISKTSHVTHPWPTLIGRPQYNIRSLSFACRAPFDPFNKRQADHHHQQHRV